MHSARIVALAEANAPQMAQAAAILAATWPEYYGPDGPGNAAQDIAERSNADQLPTGIIAITDRVIGVAALALTGFGAVRSDETPWLVGLAVLPEARNQGCGLRLIAAIENTARQNGHAEVFCTTHTVARTLSRREWQELRQIVDDHGQPWTVFRKTL